MTTRPIRQSGLAWDDHLGDDELTLARKLGDSAKHYFRNPKLLERATAYLDAVASLRRPPDVSEDGEWRDRVARSFIGFCALEGIPIEYCRWIFESVVAKRWITPWPWNPRGPVIRPDLGFGDEFRCGDAVTIRIGPRTLPADLKFLRPAAVEAAELSASWGTTRMTQSVERCELWDALGRVLADNAGQIRSQHHAVMLWHNEACPRPDGLHRIPGQPYSGPAHLGECDIARIDALRGLLKRDKAWRDAVRSASVTI